MKEEFLDLYNKWYASYMFSAVGSSDPGAKESYEKLKEWCENNKKEALQYIKELLLEKPGDIVLVLDHLYNNGKALFKGFCPLNKYCNIWLNILHKTENIDYYKDYNEWSEYLKKEYIPWDPRVEDDPNVTLEQFKEGKRNPKGARKNKMKELNLPEYES